MTVTRQRRLARLILLVSVLSPGGAWADVVTDWNIKAGEIFLEAKPPAPVASRAAAIVQTPCTKRRMPSRGATRRAG